MKWIIGRQDAEGVWLYLAKTEISPGETWTPDIRKARTFDIRREATEKRLELRKRWFGPVWVIETEPVERVDVTFSVTVSIEAAHNTAKETIAESAIPLAIEALRNDGIFDHYEGSKPTEM